MSKNPLINAFFASVVTLINFVTQYIFSVRLVDKTDAFFTQTIVLFMIIISVIVMAFLFFYQPSMLFIEGKKKQAVNLFAKTVKIFAVFIIFLFMFSIVIL
ncbi:MAG: hypothetical protein ACOZAK_03185 [Patescibacteria group bacterium]